MSEPFIGEIRMTGFSFAPAGWGFCDGQALPVEQNIMLYTLLGSVYGGDGEKTFCLPDLRGRLAMHQGSGKYIGDCHEMKFGIAEPYYVQPSLVVNFIIALDGNYPSRY